MAQPPMASPATISPTTLVRTSTRAAARRQLFDRVFLPVAEEDGLVRGEEGSKAKQATLGGEQADEFLLALPQHRSRELGMGAHHVMLDQDLFILSHPPPDKGPAQVYHLPFAFLLKGPFGQVASPPFLPEGGDLLLSPRSLAQSSPDSTSETPARSGRIY
jgi:hypothetical protein